MHTAQVQSWGEAPKLVSLPSPDQPSPDSDLVQVHLLATGVHQLVRSRASGTHYSKAALPHTPGVDGVGFIPSENNRKVYFMSLGGRGTFSSIMNVRRSDIFDLPDGLDPVQVAALSNPGMSSQLAVTLRTRDLPENFNALILGATTMSGKAARATLKNLGAGKIYGVARNEEALKSSRLDSYAVLKNPPSETEWENVLADVDFVLDYVYGEPLAALFKALKPGRRVQVVAIGAVSRTSIPLDSAILRSTDLTITGSGLGNWGSKEVAQVMPAVLEALKDVEPQKVKQVKLSEIEEAWNEKNERLVVVP